jgi:hypothetical protein
MKGQLKRQNGTIIKKLNNRQKAKQIKNETIHARNSQVSHKTLIACKARSVFEIIYLIPGKKIKKTKLLIA